MSWAAVLDSIDCKECSGEFSQCLHLCVAPTLRCPSLSWTQASLRAVYSEMTIPSHNPWHGVEHCSTTDEKGLACWGRPIDIWWAQGWRWVVFCVQTCVGFNVCIPEGLKEQPSCRILRLSQDLNNKCRYWNRGWCLYIFEDLGLGIVHWLLTYLKIVFGEVVWSSSIFFITSIEFNSYFVWH